VYLFEKLQFMARSHHRKKHKEHVRQFRNSHDTTDTTARTKASSIFSIIGAITGGAVCYFASSGNWMWISAGLIAGAVLGHFIGKKLD
jgi:uncharacterized protein YcfJ